MDENARNIEPAELREGLKKVRSRRWFLWLIILIYLPSMMLALRAEDQRTWVAATFVSWIVLLIIAVARACLVRCPRCGEQFHTHGPTFLPFRRCLHCSLHVNADKRSPEAHPPKARFAPKSEKNTINKSDS